MLRFLLVVACVSLQRATAFKIPECQEHLAQQAAQQAALEVGDKGVVKRPEWKWGGHTFNNTRYTTVAGIDPATSCGANFTGVIRDHDVTYLTGAVNGTVPGIPAPPAVGGVVMAKSGNGTWAGAVKLYFGQIFAGWGSADAPGWSHICGTINGVRLHGKIGWAPDSFRIDLRPANTPSDGDDDDDDDIAMDPDCAGWVVTPDPPGPPGPPPGPPPPGPGPSPPGPPPPAPPLPNCITKGCVPPNVPKDKAKTLCCSTGKHAKDCPGSEFRCHKE